ncbi:MAG TPA: tetratricopeptide repeat protein [Pyrinomonadaceae bacterium]
MKEAGGKHTAIYRFGRFEINAREQILRSEGEIVALTPKVFETLLLLVENNGQIVSKDEIMQTVWADSFVEETNLTSNISRLRKFFQEESGEKFIETFPKRGYRFSADVKEIADNAEIKLTRRVKMHLRQIVEDADEVERDEFALFLTSVPNNLPPPRARLVGREKEIEEVLNLLQKNRFVTLTGVGGTGKTRLALEIARRALPDFADGVFFAELADIRQTELVISTIAQTLGLKESGGKSLLETILDFLSEKQLLLVVDNFEQVLKAAPVLAELASNAAHLRILATSRALLRIDREKEFIVPPLGLPDLNNNAESLLHSESVNLFVERAQAIKPSLGLAVENVRIIAEICHRLEGLPLAIELAAVRIKILSLQAIQARLENRLKLLTGGMKNSPTRQQTMRGAITWSFDLLEAEEQVLFRRLAVFAGGFTVEAAEAICEMPEPKTLSIDVLNGITSLVENSLLNQIEQPNGEFRFRLLEVVREYSLEQLEACGEAETMRENHAAFFLALAEEEADRKFSGADAALWLNQFDEEHENLRTALQWSIEKKPETALRLVGAAHMFWNIRGYLTEGRGWLEAALKKGDHVEAAIRWKALLAIAQTARYQGDNESARKFFEQSLAAAEKSGDKQKAAKSIRGLGQVARLEGNLAEARKFLKKSLALGREFGDESIIAFSLSTLGEVARTENEFAEAKSFYEGALQLCLQMNHKEGAGATLCNLGAVEFCIGNSAAALAHYQKALTIALELGHKVSIAIALDGFAALAVRSRQPEKAAYLSGASENLFEQIGYKLENTDRSFRDAYLAELRTSLDQEILQKNYRQGYEIKIAEVITITEQLINKIKNEA